MKAASIEVKREVLQSAPAATPILALRHRRAPPAPQASAVSWTRDQLRAGLDAGQFIPYFQPKVDLVTDTVHGVEILARWNHPVHGLLQPSCFIDALEYNGLIDSLTESIVHAALACAHACSARGCELNFALNVSPLTLREPGAAARLIDLLSDASLAPARLTIELTETASSASYPAVLDALLRARAGGIEVSIDDFGTGHSSLALLNSMPFTELKIDRAFVCEGVRTDKSQAIAESIVQLARKLGLRTVAEGIETGGELAYVRALGCSVGQGYLFARPMDQAGLMDFLGTMHPRRHLHQSGTGTSRPLLTPPSLVALRSRKAAGVAPVQPRKAR